MRAHRDEIATWRLRWMLLGLILAKATIAIAQDPAAIRRPRRQVIVSIADRKLAVVENGTVIRIFSVAVGADVSPSPTGTFLIANRLVNPTYYHPGVVIPAGAANPIGPRWIGLNRKGYGIHGTNEPRSIGQAASHGCIRLRNRDVEQLYTMVSVGDEVEIRADRDEEIAQIFGGQPNRTLQASVETPARVGQ